MNSQKSKRPDVQRCDREIAEAEDLIRSGHKDIEGLCQALADWSYERRLLIARNLEVGR